ncbi:BRO family protein [Acuticoccus kandeliae]|uniref:BRO family protein n=1 Tax=Acuticoccus kandeliae TaxID=2073160 RepID=UPI000D3EE108
MTTSFKSTPSFRVFNFEGIEVRQVEDESRLYIYLTDVCRGLGQFIKRRGDTNSRYATTFISHTNWISRTAEQLRFKGRPTFLVNRDGVRQLADHVDTPRAHAFREWAERVVFNTV